MPLFSLRERNSESLPLVVPVFADGIDVPLVERLDPQKAILSVGQDLQNVHPSLQHVRNRTISLHLAYPPERPGYTIHGGGKGSLEKVPDSLSPTVLPADVLD